MHARRATIYRSCFVAVLLGAACTSHSAQNSGDVTSGELTVRHALSPAPIKAGALESQEMSVYLSIDNRGNSPDTLVNVASNASVSATLHSNVQLGREVTMQMLPTVAITPHSTLRFSPGGMHIMLDHLQRDVVVGDSIPLVLTFRGNKQVRLQVRVVAYDSLQRLLESGR